MTVLTDHASPYCAATLPQRRALHWQATSYHYLLCEQGALKQLDAFATTARSHAYEMLGEVPLAEVEKRLAGMPISAHLLAIGSEPYLQQIDSMAWRLRIGPERLQSQRIGLETRDVLCMHCRAVAPNITHRIYRCGCGVHVLVRDHYSARRGLYQGAPLADADALIELLADQPLGA